MLDQPNCWTSDYPGDLWNSKLRQALRAQKPLSIAEWSEEAEKRFIEKVADGETTFLVHMKKPDEKAQDELFMGEKSMVDELIELCPKATNRSYHDSDYTFDDSKMENSIVKLTNKEDTSTGNEDLNIKISTDNWTNALFYSKPATASLESSEVGKIFYRAAIWKFKE